MSQFRKNIQRKPVAQGIDQKRVEETLEKVSHDPKAQQILLRELEKELKAETPNEAAPLLEFVLKHIKEIIVLIVIFILAATTWGVWKWNSDREYLAYQNEFKQILTVLDPVSRLEQLERFGEKAPDAMKTGVYIEIATTSNIAEQYDKAAANYLKVIEREKGTALGLALQFSLADTYLNNGEAEKALAVMEALLPRVTDEMKTVTMEQIAVYAEEAGDKEKAARIYRELLILVNTEIDTAYVADYYNSRIAELSM